MTRHEFLTGAVVAAAAPFAASGASVQADAPDRSFSFDHVVVGGGFAGVAAALASARNGAKTCLVERTCVLGGLSTAGHVVVFLPLCDGYGRQVTFGIPEELMLLPTRYSDAKPKKDRYELVFDPGPMMLGLEQTLLDAGVELFYDTGVVGADVADGGISALRAVCDGERISFRANAFTDATGSAVVARLCGAATVSGKEGNRPGGWYYVVDSERRISLRCGAGRRYAAANPADAAFRDGGDMAERSGHILATRRAILADNAAENARLAAEDGKSVRIFSIPTYPTMLKLRRVVGRTDGAVVAVVSDWRERGPVYPIRFGQLLVGGVRNLLAAGRCMACEESMWDVYRCLPSCTASGQAAGTAAAMLAKGGAFAGLDMALLRERLVSAGVRLDESLLKPNPAYKPSDPKTFRDEGT